jgi:hypothetical protein
MDRDIQRFRVGIHSPIIRPDNYGTLTNIRASSCYLNTSLQMLYRIHTFRLMLENINLHNPQLIQLARVNDDIAKGRTILRILKHIFIRFSRGDHNINLETDDVYEQLVILSGLTCGEQQDMTEFILNIINIISKFYANPQVKNFMDSITFNQIQHTICENGKDVIRDPMVMFNDQDRIDQLAESKLFIGLGSGLSWLAWSTGIDTILISGFSEPYAEFKATERIINENVCHGCFNNVKLDPSDWNWCPSFKNTDKQFICTKEISPTQVIDAINKVLNL